MSGRSMSPSDSNSNVVASSLAQPVATTADLQAQLEMLAAENAELRRSVQLRDRMLDLTSKGCIVIDARHVAQPVVFINRILARQTGHSVSQLVGLQATVEVEDPAKKTHTVRIGEHVVLRGTMIESVTGVDGRITHYIGISAAKDS